MVLNAESIISHFAVEKNDSEVFNENLRNWNPVFRECAGMKNTRFDT